jgi:hypothetical protein
VLGLALGERKALVAEVSGAGGGRAGATVERVGEFAYPQGAGLNEPEALGRALGHFLSEQGFTSRATVVGLPGKWLLTKRVDAPPAAPALVADTLRLQAEGEFAGDGGEFVFDYAGEASASQAKPVLLMAAPRRHMDQVTAIISAARLKAVAVVPYAATLAARAAKDSRVLLFGPGGAEFVSQNGIYPRALRYLGPTSSPTPLLASEVRRASAGAAMGIGGELALHTSRSNNGSPVGELLVWNDAGIHADALHALGESLGAPVKLGDLRTLGATQAAGAANAAGYGAAVALALAALEPGGRGARGGLPVDFLHSRLAPVREVRFERRSVLLGVAAAVIVLVAATAILTLRNGRAEVDAMQKQLASATDSVKKAKATVAKVEFAQAWQDTDPRFVACLYELTKSLPEDGQTFLTSFNLNDELKGGMSGKASNSLDVLMLRDRLAASGRFADIKGPWFDAPRGKVEAPQRAAPAQPGPPQGQPQPPQPGPMPTPGPGPGGMPAGMPPGAVVDPDANMPGGAVGPMAVAMAMPAQGGPVAMPPGAVPSPGGPGPAQAEKAARAPRAPRGGGPPGASGPQGPGGPAGPAAAPGGEVTFSMTFNYVPEKKKG